MNFLFDIELCSDYYKVRTSTSYEKIVFKSFLALSIALARPGTILSIIGEITRAKHVLKTYNFRIISGMCNMSIDSKTLGINSYTKTFYTEGKNGITFDIPVLSLNNDSCILLFSDYVV